MNTKYEWYNQAKFGIMITWGGFSVYGKGENVQFNERIPVPEYQNRLSHFKPDNFSPVSWVRFAKENGMNYIIMTARHVDGYCLFNSKVNEFNSLNYGPGKDLVREFVDACKAENMRFGFFFSLADTRSTAYLQGPEINRTRWDEYVASQHLQIKELLSNYGGIDIIWYDTGWPYHELRDISDYWYGGCWPHKPEDWKRDELNEMIKGIYPDIIIQSQLTVDGYPLGGTINKSAREFGNKWPEYYGYGEGGWGETAMTLNASWGYNKSDKHWKSPEEIIKNWMFRGGTYNGGMNYLLNIAPDENGNIPREAQNILNEFGGWMKRNSGALMNTKPYSFPPFGRIYFDDSSNKSYCFFLNWPENGKAELCTGGFGAGDIKQIYFLHDNAPVKYSVLEERIILLYDLPKKSPEKYCSVIVIEFEK